MSNTKPKTEVLHVKNLMKSFDGRPVLEDISLSLNSGETLVIMGGSGCGKSTMLRILVGMLKADRGDIRMFGKDVTNMHPDESEELKKRFGILFQSGALFNSMTVGENVALPILEHTDLDETIVEIMVKMKLEQVGLRDFENLKPSQISGGMKKRVALARAIALDPEIIFYDEPGAGLDPIVNAGIDELINGLRDSMNVASVVVTHKMKSAFSIADKMILLYQGRVVAQGTPEDIKNCEDPLVQQFINGSVEGPIPLNISSKDYIEDLLGT
jgi:phospholipid/cholesterol/gamma-HCH transport system ATP-binding protein